MEETRKTGANTKSKRSIIIKITIAVVIVALAAGLYFAATYMAQLQEYKKRIAEISITNVDLSKIPDGSYTGSYDAIMIAAKVRVDVSDHAIKGIDILYHKNERGKKAEAVVNEVKSAQSLKVDTITGATNSSKVLLKAMQNALNSGLKA
ncbi:FMN-binding protein [Ethanoligenens harbinense]|uniref:FMN-binding domain protein n=1 Tax=Ethanoligenens harbinense (strain DSM 18485 / JCM 12961 / CGMCC 1.5033 / YUAN-3) TaxID=663278 RepID=E6U4G0_ETHHY|nr:FMN-binding protein [Ethanoligenens harbinense]ADU27767.1 FMN-binding domain protein [Ethanoligenens harbinense YUAN-3]AVQ96790.1 FMN-binding protein [Ethanoligenens harbinense YUAN-3]AYF39452.1 FMN-binding protein [Ethanoligenens harbinense]AYF42276.1 FMN-binding protein [Ethanoligenens harbinense]QCN93031.1 FMN-binding protein [Ethanoligenens harbinense]